MARRDDEVSGLDRVFAQLDGAPPGLHDVEPPSADLPSGLPAALIELYAHCDGARLYLDSVELVASAAVEQRDERWKFGTLEDEDLLVDARGRVWRNDASLDDLVCEGTKLERWLAGIVDAIGVLYDSDGEFVDNAFDEDGELEPAIAERQLRAQLKRDPHAPGPRWRLAHLLLLQGSVSSTGGVAPRPAGKAGRVPTPHRLTSFVEDARAQLEDVVAHDPSFAWAWLDLAKISEQLGDLPGALDEARAAADAAVGHPQAGYFHAQLARIASRAGEEGTRTRAAAKVAELAPGLKADQLAGANASLASGDSASARGLLELLRAVWPRDLAVLDLAKRIEQSEN